MSDEHEDDGLMSGIGFLLLAQPALPPARAVVEAAAERGLTLTESVSATESDSGDPLIVSLESDAGPLMVALMPAPHPDAGNMAYGPMSPEPDDAVAAPAHAIVTAPGLLGVEGDPSEADETLARLMAAVVAAAGDGAVGAMMGHGVMFVQPEAFVGAVSMYDAGELPVEVCVDVTVAAEDDERCSLLTHGLSRYGREEFFITASQGGFGDAFEFIYDLSRWMVTDREYHLPTGDTLGPSAEVRYEIQRGPSPTGSGETVVRIDM